MEYHNIYDWPCLFALSTKPASKTRLISNEYFSHPQGGWKRIRREATLLKRLFPDAKVLLTARKDQEQLDSTYRYSVECAGAIGRDAWERRFLSRHPDWHQWHHHADLWGEFFEVTVLHLDWLRDEPANYLKILSYVLDVPVEGIDMTPVNEGPKGWRLQALKALNCLTGINDLEQGRRPQAWPRRILNVTG